MLRPAALYNRRKWQLIGKSQWCCSANCGHPLHALTYNWTRGMQLELANTPPLQSTTQGLRPVSIHRTSPPVRGSRHPIAAYYSFIDLERMKGWVDLVGWLHTEIKCRLREYCVTTPMCAGHWPLTWTFNPWRATAMIHTCTKTQVQWSIGSKDKVVTNERTDGRTDGRTDANDCFAFLANALAKFIVFSLHNIT